jgi:hypothetical protein
MRARLFLAFLLPLAPFLAGGAAAQSSGAQPLDRLLPQIRRNVPGHFLDAEGASAGGNPHYHLKWLTPDGRVMWLDTDARTGRVLRQSPGRDSFDSQRARGDAQRPRSEEQGDPPDRRDEGRSTVPRDDPPDAARPDNRRQYRQPDNGGNDNRGGFSRPDRNFDGRFDRAPGSDRGGNDSRFGGRNSGNGGFGSRGFGGGNGGHDRRGNGR